MSRAPPAARTLTVLRFLPLSDVRELLLAPLSVKMIDSNAADIAAQRRSKVASQIDRASSRSLSSPATVRAEPSP